MVGNPVSESGTRESRLRSGPEVSRGPQPSMKGCRMPRSHWSQFARSPRTEVLGVASRSRLPANASRAARLCSASPSPCFISAALPASRGCSVARRDARRRLWRAASLPRRAVETPRCERARGCHVALVTWASPGSPFLTTHGVFGIVPRFHAVRSRLVRFCFSRRFCSSCL